MHILERSVATNFDDEGKTKGWNQYFKHSIFQILLRGISQWSKVGPINFNSFINVLGYYIKGCKKFHLLAFFCGVKVFSKENIC